jgi:hypothetical protein
VPALHSDLDFGSSTATSAAATAAAVAIVTAAADLRLCCLVSIATAAVAAVRVMHLPLFKAAGGLPVGKSEGDRMFVTTLNLKCWPRVTPSQVPPAAKSLPVATKCRRTVSRLYKINLLCSTSYHRQYHPEDDALHLRKWCAEYM